MEIINTCQEYSKEELDTLRKTVNYDLDTAIRFLKLYTQAVDTDSFLIDNKGKIIFSTYTSGIYCTFCQRIQNLLDDNLQCSHVHLYGSYQAERFGGKYIFFCPIGMVHWASPIMVEGMMQGAMLGGPVSITSTDDFLINEVVEKHNIRGSVIGELKASIKEVKYISPGRVSSMAEMLSLVAGQVSKLNPVQVAEDQDNLQQQSQIAEYIHFLKSMGGDDETMDNTYPIDKERELLALISSGDKEGSRKVLNEILGHVFFASGRNFDVVKSRILELVVLLSRAALEGGASLDEIFGLNYKYLNQIHTYTSVDQLASWLSRIMNRFTDCVFDLRDVKHVDVIYKALEFVKKNYMNKISLNDVAETANISPSYFSKVFKEEMKFNFNMYLNQFRVNMSKKLLMDDSVSLVNIAFLTGFEDQSYFSKVFKKITGMSPGKYRESMGRKKQDKTG